MATINEAVGIGCSIMDTYFDRLDSRALKKAGGEDASIDEDEDEEVAAGNFEAAANLEDFIIYESKDPYVLRSLPYLIGSQGYLENDHVGLKDLESDEEEEEDEMETEAKDDSSVSSSSSPSEDEEDTGTKKESQPSKKRVVDEDSASEKSSVKSFDRLAGKKKKEENLFDESEEDDDDGIFNLGGKIVKSIHS